MPLHRRLACAVLLVGHGQTVDWSSEGVGLVFVGLAACLPVAFWGAVLSWATPWWPLNTLLVVPAFLLTFLLTGTALTYACKGLAQLLLRLERTARHTLRQASDEELDWLVRIPAFGLWRQHLEQIARDGRLGDMDYHGLDRASAALCLALHERGLLVDRYNSRRLVVRRGARELASAEIQAREARRVETYIPGRRTRLSPLGS